MQILKSDYKLHTWVWNIPLQSEVALISRWLNCVPKEHVFRPDLTSVISEAPRLVTGTHELFVGRLKLEAGNSHQQQLQFPSETPGCSEWLWRLWKNLVPSDVKLHASCHPGDGSHCIAEHLGAPATCLGAPQITVQQSEKSNIFFGNAADAPGTHSYY
jgi:hypothetical protein